MISKNIDLINGLHGYQCYYIHKMYILSKDGNHIGNFLTLQFARNYIESRV